MASSIRSTSSSRDSRSSAACRQRGPSSGSRTRQSSTSRRCWARSSAIVGLGEQARHPAPEDLGRSTDGRRHDGETAGQCLHDRARKRFGPHAGNARHVRRLEKRDHIVAAREPRHREAVAQRSQFLLRSEPPQPGLPRRWLNRGPRGGNAQPSRPPNERHGAARQHPSPVQSGLRRRSLGLQGRSRAPAWSSSRAVSASGSIGLEVDGGERHDGPVGSESRVAPEAQGVLGDGNRGVHLGQDRPHPAGQMFGCRKAQVVDDGRRTSRGHRHGERQDPSSGRRRRCRARVPGRLGWPRPRSESSAMDGPAGAAWWGRGSW